LSQNKCMQEHSKRDIWRNMVEYTSSHHVNSFILNNSNLHSRLDVTAFTQSKIVCS